MCHIGTDFCCSMGGQHFLAFNQSATRLYQIINNDNMAPFRISFLDTYNSLVTFPNFCTNNRWEMLQLLMKSFPCTIIRKSYGYIVRIRKLLKPCFQQWYPTIKAWKNIITKVEPLLQVMLRSSMASDSAAIRSASAFVSAQ